MRTIRTWGYAAALALVLAGGYAHATTYDVTFDSAGFFELKSDKLASGSFQDIFRFSLAAPGMLVAGFIVIGFIARRRKRNFG